MRPAPRHARGSARIRKPLQFPLRLELLEQRTLLTAQLSPLAEFSALSVDPDSYDASKILVRFLPQAVTLRAEAAVAGAEIGVAPLRSLPDLRIVHLPPTTNVETALAAFRADPQVLYAEPDYRVHATAVPGDPRFGELWNLNNLGQTGGTVDADIDAPGGWDVTVGSGSTVVAVIDTGVNYNHADLATNMWINPGEVPGDNIDNDGNGYVDDVHGYDFANNDSDPLDDQGHGTHVAGTIGAIGDNGIGVAGINWNVQIMALKFLGADASGSSSAAIEAINYAVMNGAKISNNSWGGDPFSQAMFDAIAAARDADHVFVTAAGNGDVLGNGLNNDASPFYPASYQLDNIVAVAAVDHDDHLAAFSNYGATSVDLAAPGVNILSTTRNGGYGLSTGTSMASPHVAGVTALVRDLNVTWSYDQVISQVLSTVDPLPGLFGITATGGRLNMAAALGNPEPPVPQGPPATLPVLEDFTDGLGDFFQPQAGNWGISNGRYDVTPVIDNQDLMAISTLRLDSPLPSNLELQATLNAEEGRLVLFGVVFRDFLTNSLLIFDYQGLDDFKFAGADIDQGQWVIGHFDDNGWGIDAFLNAALEPGTDYQVRLLIQDGTDVTLEVGAGSTLNHSFLQPVNDGQIGVGMRNSISHFDNILLRPHILPTPASLPIVEDFEGVSVDHFQQRAGVAGLVDGRYELTPFTFSDAISTVEIGDPLPGNLELQVTINADDRSLDRFSNAFVIFDYVGPSHFKFAGAFVGANEWVIGHRDAVNWTVDAVLPATIQPLTDYQLRVQIEGDHDVTLFADGVAQVGHSFADSLTDGSLGLGTQNAISRFDDLVVQTATPLPPAALPLQEDFQDGEADYFGIRSGSWRVSGGRLAAAPTVFQDVISTVEIGDPLPGNLELEVTIKTDDRSLDRFSNAFVIFDYVGPSHFKFAGAFVGANEWVIGHRDAVDWTVDAVLPATIQPLTDYQLRVQIEGDHDVTLFVDGVARLGHSFADSLTDGVLGLGTQNAISRFDELVIQTATLPPAALPLQEDFEDGGADYVRVRTGSWSVGAGQLLMTPGVYEDGISTLRIGDPLPGDLELEVTINADDRSLDRFSNAFVIFDYVGPSHFKFAGAFVGANEWVIGHRDAVDWTVDAVLPATIQPLTDYQLRVLIEGDRDVSLFVDGVARLGHSFADSLTDGALGLGTQNAISRFDELVIQTATLPPAALPLQEDFEDGGADYVRVRTGSWSVGAGQLLMTPGVYEDGISTLRIGDPLPGDLELEVTINADDRSLDRFSNAFVIFDYVGPSHFKFAGAFVGANEWVIGHRDAVDWTVDAVLPATIQPLTDYQLRVLIEGDHDVTLFADGVAQVGHSFADSLTDGVLGLGTQNAISRFDDLVVQTANPLPPAALPLQEDFQDGEADSFGVRSGSWRVSGGRLAAAPTVFQDVISTVEIGDPLPGNLELEVTINADDRSLDRFSNAFVIFDYVGPSHFKFAGAFVGANEWVIGHRDAVDWTVDAVLPATIQPLTDYQLRVQIEGDHDVTLFVDGVARLGHSFADSLTDGVLGLGTQNAISRFDELVIQTATLPPAALPLQEDFEDGGADYVRVRTGSWSVGAGQLLMTPGVYEDGISTLRIGDPLPGDLELEVTINADDRSLDRFSNAFVIFDYVGPSHFKFAGAFVGANEWVIGHRDAVDWTVDAVLPATIQPLTDYQLRVQIEGDHDVTLFADGVAQVGHSFADSLTDGVLGLGTQNAISRFDEVIVTASAQDQVAPVAPLFETQQLLATSTEHESSTASETPPQRKIKATHNDPRMIVASDLLLVRDDRHGVIGEAMPKFSTMFQGVQADLTDRVFDEYDAWSRTNAN